MELADYVAIIRRWWWLLVASLIVGALLGYLGWTITSSDSYRATVALTSEEYRQVFESPPDVYEATTTLLVEIDRSRPEPSEPTVQWTITTGRQDAELDPINGGFIGGAISTVMAPDRESAIQLVRANVPPDHTQVLVIGIVPEMTPTGWSADKLEVALPTLLSQRRILEAAIGLAGLDFGTSDDVAELRERLVISRRTPVVKVTVRSVSPAEAQITANAVVEAFVQSELLASSGLPGSVSILDAAVLPSNPISPFPPLSVSEVAARTAVLEEVLKSLVSRRVLLDKALSDGAIDLGTDDDVAYLQRRLEITTASPLIELSIAAGSRELALRIVSSVAATFVTSDLLRVLYSESTLVTASHAATVSEIEPSGMLSSIASGAAVLLLVAIIVALVREYFDDRVRTPEEMLAAAPVPALGLIARTSSSRSEIESLRDPPTAAGEAYRAVRTRLAQEIERRGKVLAVSGPGHGDGRTTVVANLAAVFGVAGRRVVVVDADLRTPALHDHLAVGNAIGLTTLLRTAGMDIDGAVRETDTENVSALTAGLPVPNPSELLTSARMQSLLDELRSRYDVVMVDTAPAPEYGDASVIASKADAILLVARANRTRAGELTAAFQELSTYERPIVGAILTDVRRSRLRPRRRGVEEFAEADSNAYGTGIGSASSEVAATTSD